MTDSYKTIDGISEITCRRKGSKFMAFACHIESENEIREIIGQLKKRYYDATHHCYAWRIGMRNEQTRANDDGEPSGTAGRPILGQIVSAGLTNVLVVVVRYFGGTKLGTTGLIEAYKTSAAEALNAAKAVERTYKAYYNVVFGYKATNAVMKAIKDTGATIHSMVSDNVCSIKLSIRTSDEKELKERIGKCEGAEMELEYYA
jgi:uncharacterized YigZ family protein